VDSRGFVSGKWNICFQLSQVSGGAGFRQFGLVAQVEQPLETKNAQWLMVLMGQGAINSHIKHLAH